MPDSDVQFLSVDDVLAIEERLIDRFGGVHGVRNAGLLESALFRPQKGYNTHLEKMAEDEQFIVRMLEANDYSFDKILP